MQSTPLLTNGDTALLMLPIFALLAFWMFALDERLAAPRERSSRRHFCQADENAPFLCDPDGTSFRAEGL